MVHMANAKLAKMMAAAVVGCCGVRGKKRSGETSAAMAGRAHVGGVRDASPPLYGGASMCFYEPRVAACA